MYTSLVKARVDEVKQAADREQADLDAISGALARMEGHLSALNAVVEDKLTDSAAEEVDLGFVEALQKSKSEQDTAGSLLERALDEVPGLRGDHLPQGGGSQQQLRQQHHHLGPRLRHLLLPTRQAG